MQVPYFSLTTKCNWDSDLIDFLNQHHTATKVIVDYGNEGNVELDRTLFSNNKKYNIFEWLHDQCSCAGFDASKIEFLWGNLNSSLLYENWCKFNTPTSTLGCVKVNPNWLKVTWNFARDYSNRNVANTDRRKKIFSLLSGMPKRHRAEALQYVYENNLLEECEYTWLAETRVNVLSSNIEIPKSLEGLDTTRSHFDISVTSHNPDSFFRVMDDTYFDVVTETFYTHSFYDDWLDANRPGWMSEDQVFITEKTWRCIQNKRPFIIVGNQYSLKYLHSFGFKTFPHLFDESYDNLPNSERFFSAMNEVKKACDSDRIHTLYSDTETLNILEHNWNRMSELSNV